MKYAWLLLFVIAGPIHAEEVSPLDGEWTRVMDGCADLSFESIEKLPARGGNNLVSRPQTLIIEGSRYRVKIYKSPRCSNPMLNAQQEIPLATEKCQAYGAEGDLQASATNLHVVNTREYGDGIIIWGHLFQDFDYKLYGDVLFIHPVGFDSGCADGNKRIYFIRTPMS